MGQVLRYLPSQHYAAHHDFFDPGDYGKSAAQKARGKPVSPPSATSVR